MELNRVAGIAPQVSSNSKPAGDIKKAACDFEALLIAQMLRAAREQNASDDSQSNDSILSMAEQQIAQMLSASGGLGISRLVADGLQTAPQATQLIPEVNSAESGS